MRGFRHIRRTSLWKQYFLSYLIVMLVFVFGISTYSYKEFYKFHQKIIYSEYQGKLDLIRERNESELLQLLNSSNQLTASSELTPFVFTQNPEKVVPLNRILSLFANCNDFFSNMYVIFDKDNYVYTPSSLYTLDNFVNNVMLFDSIEPNELAKDLRDVNKLLTLPEQEYSRAISGRLVKKVVPVILPIGYLEGSRYGSIMYLIDSNSYSLMLGSMATGNKSVYILGEDCVIFAREICAVPREKVLETAAAMGKGVSAIELNYDGKGYLLFKKPGKELDLSYLMLASTSDIGIAFTGTMKLFLVIIAVVFSASLLLVIYFVQKRVRPIQQLHELVKDGCPIDGSPKRNILSEIQASVRDLIQNNDELNRRMVSVEALKKAEFARRFLVGGFTNSNEWLAMAEDIHLNVDLRYFLAGILAKPSDSEYEIMPDKLNDLFDDTVSGVSCKLGPHNKVLLVAFANEEHHLYEWMENKHSEMRAYCSGLTMAVSAVHMDYREGPLAYLEAENAFENRFICGNTSVIRFDSVRDVKEDNVRYDTQLVERLRMAIKLLDRDRIRSALDDITRALRTMNTSLFMFRCIYNDILSVITKEMQDSPSLEQEVYNLYKITECLSLDDLDSMLYNVCLSLAERREKPIATVNVPDRISMAMDMINKRFSEPGISLSIIAQECGISESKLSIEFKSAYKMTPLECLTHLRMQQACRLLKYTDMPVKDISVACGNYEISGFNRRFKAYTGKTPQQYRQSET